MENGKKCANIKRIILCGVLTVLAIITGWLIYAYFNYQTPSEDHHFIPVPQEIDEFTRQLYKLELKHNPYLIKVNFQGKTDTSATDDVAPQPLLQVNETALSLPNLKTTLLLRRLYDNYELFTYQNEDITSEEREEEMDFLKAILDTAIMKQTMEFLKSKDVVTNNTDSHLELLKTLWFYPYSRKPGDKVLSSTGFEHVFLGEIRKKTVLGLHNWVYFSDQERLGHMDYKGYIEKESLAEGYQYIVTFRSQFYNKSKPYNGIFVGTSPELEMSLYTVCFVLRGGKSCPVQLGDLKFKIVTWPLVQDGKKTIGSAYPSLK
ncbi:endoribonuclease CG2145-like [Calliphora vicina]|uniref:endoribonuclease CG2145-like n=1 Tax=Calliphora vicina TaxID=7373 RepID=UPI00325BC090